MYFSPSLLTRILLQSTIDFDLRQSLVHAFTFGSEAWQLLPEIGLPAELPKTRDPMLLALRRLLRQDLEELRAMHRVAAETAATRPFGLFHLVLEEAVEMEHPDAPPAVQVDAAMRAFFELVPASGTTSTYPKEHFDLRSRSIAEVARRQILTHDATYPLFLPFAARLAEQGTGELELEIYLAETIALGLESENEPGNAALQRTYAVKKLLDFPVADRVAESLFDLAELTLRSKLDSTTATRLYEGARKKLAETPAHLNLPLRRRLALTRPAK